MHAFWLYILVNFVASEISEGIIVLKITWKTHLPIVKSGGWKWMHFIPYSIGILLFAGLISPCTANSYAVWLCMSTPIWLNNTHQEIWHSYDETFAIHDPQSWFILVNHLRHGLTLTRKYKCVLPLPTYAKVIFLPYVSQLVMAVSLHQSS
jgi:hypothetical protein